MRHHDTVAGLALLCFCALAYWLTLDFADVPAMLSQNVPPTFFPRLVITVTAIFSAILLVNGLGRPGEPAAEIPPVFWMTIAVIAVTGLVMTLLGTLLTLGLVAIALPLVWGERRYRLIVALSVGLPLGIYLVFTLGLGVRFPAGRLFELLAQTT